jgi:hypothetical protein
MGADWFYSSAYYGYSIKVPKDVNIRTYYKQLSSNFESDCEAIDVFAIYPEVHDRMDCCLKEENDELITLIIGFCVHGMNLNAISELSEKLNEYTSSDNFKSLDVCLEECCVRSSCKELYLDDCMYDDY